MEYPLGKFIVEMYVYTSCSHYGWNTNSYALIVLSGTFKFLVTLGNCEKAPPLNENALVCTPPKNHILGITIATSQFDLIVEVFWQGIEMPCGRHKKQTCSY
jgi:hypothetical protein